jgi:hypothetical protein
MSKILLFSVYDNGNQLQHLAEAIRQYTNHQAIHINMQQSYLDYPADVKLPEHMEYPEFRALIDDVVDCDFFIFSEVLPVDVKDTLDKFHVYSKINPTNTIIRTAGSYRTLNPDKLLLAWIRENWMFAGPYSDWYISGRIGRMAPVDYICPVNTIPTPQPIDDVVRVCFSPTRPEKGGAAFDRVMDRITKKYDNVEKVLISGVSWEESIRIKSGCTITFDQFMLNHYANSAIESMYLEHAVISDIGPWCRMMHPDLPVIGAHSEEELYNAIFNLIEFGDVDTVGSAGKRYVVDHHHPSIVAKQWDRLINHVTNL